MSTSSDSTDKSCCCEQRCDFDSEDSSLKQLKSLREKMRKEYLSQIDPIIKNWQGPLPNLRDIFRKDEIDWLLTESTIDTPERLFNDEGKRFIKFVVETGYEDEPEVDRDAKPSPRRTTPLHHASKSKWNNRDMVGDLFKIYNRFDVNYTDESGLTHFHMACDCGCNDVVEKFLELGQDPNCFEQNSNESPLHLAFKNEDEKVVELLLRHGADPNTVDKDGLTPLHVICQRGNYWEDKRDDLINILFELSNDKYQPIQINAQNNEFGNTPLHLAVLYCDTIMIEILLKKGADPNVANAEGLTPLHTCIRDNYDGYEPQRDGVISPRELLEFFFKFIDDVEQTLQLDAQDKFGNTPLHLALEDVEYNEPFELLMKRGANPNVANAEGLTPLHIICHRSNINKCDEIELAKMIFELMNVKNQPVHVNAQDNLGNTPLHFILDYPFDAAEIVELLLSNGANPNLANVEGLTCLHILSYGRHDYDNLVKMMFELSNDKYKPIQVNARDKLGRTPLQWAVAKLLPKTIDVLLNNGADISSFVFPTESYFYEKKDIPRHDESWYNFHVRLVVIALIVVEHLEEKGYQLDRSEATTIMKFFAKYRFFGKSVGLGKRWYEDEEFVSEAKKHTLSSSLSLYDLIQSPPYKVTQLFTFTDYLEFERTSKCLLPPKWDNETCSVYVCEKLSRGFFRRWTLDPFLKLTRNQLPILCCELIIKKLMNKDLWYIYLATTDKNFSDICCNRYFT